MTQSSQYPYNNRHGQPIQPIRPHSQQTYLPQYNNNAPHLPQMSNGGAPGYNLNDTPVFQRPQPGPQQPPSNIQQVSLTNNFKVGYLLQNILFTLFFFLYLFSIYYFRATAIMVLLP